VKGMVFTNLEDMVTETFGMDMWDDVLERSKVEHGGAYTAVGNYPPEELHAIVDAICELTQLDKPTALQAYGHYLSQVFIKKFPEFFTETHSTVDLLMKVDSYIHVEVRKLYPDASLPKLDSKLISENEMTLNYLSENCLSHFAEGLINGVAHHFNEKVTIERLQENETGSAVLLKVTSEKNTQ